MARYSDITTLDANGTPHAGVYVTIKNDDGTLATLTTDGGGSIGNPTTTDADGSFYFNVTPGIYSMEFRNSLLESPRIVQAVTLPVSPGAGYPTRAAMAGANPPPRNLDDAYLTEAGREGKFVFSTADMSAAVAADVRQGIYVARSGDSTGASGAWVRKFDVAASPEWFREAGDPDDSAALRAWLAFDAPLHKLDRRKTYLVAPAVVGGIILPLTGTRQIDLNGATIKVKNSSGEYMAIIGSDSFAVDLSFTSIWGGTIDHNQAGNTFGIASSLLNNPHSTFRARKGTDIEVCDNTIKNAATTNSIYVNGWESAGAVQNTKRLRVNRNRWLSLGGGATYYDHSTIYFHGEGFECFDNLVIGTSLGANGTKCFLEPHGTFIRASRNEVRNMDGFANVTGVYSGGDTERSIISHNSGDVLQFGVRIFSVAYEGHVSGYGINGLEVDSNNFRIHQSLLPADTSLVYMGVGVQAGATLPVKDLWITRNKVIYDEETVAPAYTALSAALGVMQTLGTVLFENIVIDGNEVVNSPGPAAALGFGGGVFKNCAITRANRFVNPGQSLATALTSYHFAIYLVANEYQGTLDASATIVDTFATSRLTGAVTSSVTVSSTTCLVRSDLEVYLAGTTLSSYGRTFRNTGALLAPLLRARVNKAPNVALSDQTGFKTGSRIEDTNAGIAYMVHLTGGAFVGQNYITAVNSTSGATYTLVITDLGNLRRFTNATGVTVTVPPTTSVAFPIGSKVDIEQAGAGVVTVAAGAGVTLVAQGGTLTTAAQYHKRTLTKIAADTWHVA